MWAAAITLFHLASAWKGHSIYRDIHLGTALNYAKGTIDWFRPVIVGFNLNGAPTPQELPVWQGMAAGFFKVLGPWFGWANVVSLLWFFSCLYPLFRLAQRFAVGDWSFSKSENQAQRADQVGWWTLLLFLSQPLIFLYAGMASPDGMSLAVTVWFLFFATKLWEKPTPIWIGLTGVTGALAAVSKLPFFVAAGLAVFFMTAAHYRDRRGAWVALGIAALFSGLVFLVWSRFANGLYAQAELPFVDLRLSNRDSFWWYFGDWRYRTTPGVYVRGAWRIVSALFGSFALLALFLLGLAWKPSSRLARWWLLGAAISTLIFFHIVLEHSHYYLMFAPAVAMLGAQAAVRFEGVLREQSGRRQWLGFGILLAGLLASTVQGVSGRYAIIHFDKYPGTIAGLIRQHSGPSEKLVMQGGGWGGELFFLSERQGLSVWDSKVLEDPQTYARLKSLGYTKLVMVSASPLLAAIEHVTSTSAKPDRETYQQHMTPIVDRLPTVFQSEDILIKQLP